MKSSKKKTKEISKTTTEIAPVKEARLIELAFLFLSDLNDLSNEPMTQHEEDYIKNKFGTNDTSVAIQQLTDTYAHLFTK